MCFSILLASNLFCYYIERKELDNVDFINQTSTNSFKYEDDLTHRNILIKLNPYSFILSNFYWNSIYIT